MEYYDIMNGILFIMYYYSEWCIFDRDEFFNV